MALKLFQILQSAARTSGGNSEPFDLLTGTMLWIAVNITAGSGTVADFDLWLEVADSKASTIWYPFPADLVIPPSLVVATNQVNIVNNKASITAEKYSGVFKHTPAGAGRLVWAFTGGSTPSLTFDALGTAK